MTTASIPDASEGRWNRPLTAPTDHQRAVAAAVADELRQRHGVQAAVLSGSLAAGLAHANSDLDIHVVAAATEDVRQFQGIREGLRVQAIRHTPDELAAICDRGSAYVATRADQAQTWLTDMERWDLMRVAIGTPLFAEGQAAEHLRRLDRDVVRRVLMANFAHPVQRAAEDAAGALEAGDLPTALYSSVYALRHALEVALAATGDLYCVEKFLFARLGRNATLAARAPELWELTCCSPAWGADQARAAAVAARRLAVATDLVSRSLLDGWDAPLAAAPEPASDEGGPIRAAGFGLQRFADGWALAGPSAGLAVVGDMARLWSLLDGRSTSHLADAMTDALGHPVTRDEVQGAVDVLVAKGAAVTRPA